MITKTEVIKAIADNEANVGWGVLDRTPTEIAKGDLCILIEAAKRARFVNAYNGSENNAPSASGMILPDEY